MVPSQIWVSNRVPSQSYAWCHSWGFNKGEHFKIGFYVRVGISKSGVKSGIRIQVKIRVFK